MRRERQGSFLGRVLRQGRCFPPAVRLGERVSRHLSWFPQVCSREARAACTSAWHQVPGFSGQETLVQPALCLWASLSSDGEAGRSASGPCVRRRRTGRADCHLGVPPSAASWPQPTLGYHDLGDFKQKLVSQPRRVGIKVSAEPGFLCRISGQPFLAPSWLPVAPGDSGTLRLVAASPCLRPPSSHGLLPGSLPLLTAVTTPRC